MQTLVRWRNCYFNATLGLVSMLGILDGTLKRNWLMAGFYLMILLWDVGTVLEQIASRKRLERAALALHDQLGDSVGYLSDMPPDKSLGIGSWVLIGLGLLWMLVPPYTWFYMSGGLICLGGGLFLREIATCSDTLIPVSPSNPDELI